MSLAALALGKVCMLFLRKRFQQRQSPVHQSVCPYRNLSMQKRAGRPEVATRAVLFRIWSRLDLVTLPVSPLTPLLVLTRSKRATSPRSPQH